MNNEIGATMQPMLADRRLMCFMTCSCVESEYGEINVRYGLRFKRQARTLKDVPDISGNALQVRELMLLLNRERVSILHVDDVIDDFLAVHSD